MCGINGIIGKNLERIQLMNQEIKHRGPDDSGIYSNNNLSLGQVRLSILDLSSKGHQPMALSKNNNLQNKDYKDEEYVIVFNGEIYNYKDLQKELNQEFESTCDTEVILKAYKKWGENCVEHFNGMWSFCIYDKIKNILFCSRDRFGQKPFYYYKSNKEFVFSSELKSIIKATKINKIQNLNKKAIEFYFSMGFIPSPYSIFNNVNKLEAGYNLIYNINKDEIELNKYYEISDYKPIKNKKELVKKGKELFKDSVRLRMISDVPIGAFLSGGLDSTSVVGEMKNFTNIENLNTYSMGFEGKYDESSYINIAKNYYNTKHHHFYYKKQDFEKDIEKYSLIYDEPFADYSGFPTSFISKKASEKIKVVLTGDGGDEIFGGYNTHVMGARMELIYRIPKIIRKILSKIPVKKNLNSMVSLYLLKEAFKLSLKDKDDFYGNSVSNSSYKSKTFQEWSKKRLNYCLKKSNNNLSEAMRIYDLLYNTLQDNFLVKVDRASMQASIETRSPFLDYRFIEYSQNIPTKYKTSLFKTKIIMREIIKDFVPKKIVYRGKQGFSPPVDKWILDKKYEKDLLKGLELIKDINKEIYNFYKKKVFKENNKIYINYKIRLFLFYKWYQRWKK